MAAVISLNSLFLSHTARLDAQIDGFERALTEIGKKFKTILEDLPYWDTTSRQLALRQLVPLQAQLRAQLTSLGYDQLAQEFVSQYTTAEVFSTQLLKALGKAELRYSPIRQDTLQNLRSMDLSAFAEYGNRAVQQISRELTLHTIAGKKRSDVIRSLKANLDTTFENAELFADTALRSYDRTVQMATWDEASIDTFEYAGPKDKRNRLFCAERIGKTYSKAQLKKMSNGTKWPVLPYLGGPRCRHYLLPQVDADDHDSPDEA